MSSLTLLANYKDQFGDSLKEMTDSSPVFLLFLRHFGCTFCMEAVADVARLRKEMEKGGTRIVFVHMGAEPAAKEFFSRYGVEDCSRISDPDRLLYRQFGLERGNLIQLFGPKNMIRGTQAFLKGARVGRIQGDGLQMPGAFLVFKGEIIKRHIHSFAGDLPDYIGMAKFEIPARA